LPAGRDIPAMGWERGENRIAGKHENQAEG